MASAGDAQVPAMPPSTADPFQRPRWHPLDLLLLAAPVALAATLWHWNGAVIFFASGMAIVPLARTIGVATEELSLQMGPAAAGLLNATFGNATELIIALFALNAGLYDVVKASLIGSILGNVLTVLGFSFLLGGWRRQRQRFNGTAARAQGAQLLVAAGALVIPAALAATSHMTSTNVYHLSVGTALVLLVGYIAGVYASLRPGSAAAPERTVAPSWSARQATIILALSTVAVAVLSEWLVHGISGLTGRLGWTDLFVGVILIAILGNAAEHASAVTAAMHDQMDLSLAIALGSASQIALFVAPALVLVGALTGRPIDLLFDSFEVVAVIIAVVLVNHLIEDGESTWLEGAQLLVVYSILALAFFLHP
jgi:Ca2+:H+ antiporter